MVTLFFGSYSFSYAVSSSTDEYAKDAIKTIDQVGSDYNGTFLGCTSDACYQSSQESPFKAVVNYNPSSSSFYNPYTEKTVEIDNIYSADRTIISDNYEDSLTVSNDEKTLMYYEGNGVPNAKFSVSGDGAYMIFYKNYANNANISVEDSGYLIATNNYVSGASINVDNSTSYFIGNVADDSTFLIKNGSEVYIKDNQAGSANITNDNSTILIESNYAEGSFIKNINNGNLIAVNNNVSDAEFTSDDSSTLILNGNTAKNAKISSDGILILNGNNAENAELSISGKAELIGNSVDNVLFLNSGVMSLYNNSGDGTTFKNSNEGQIFAYSNKVNNATMINDGYVYWGVCNNAEKCTLNEQSKITDSTITNNGIIDFVGESDMLGSSIANNGIINIDNANIESGIFDNTGIINILSDSNIMETKNTGTISFTGGSKLVINGNYTGENGTIEMNTVLGDDNSQTDSLTITGAATGKTLVTVNNLGGTGAQTTEGILLIETGSSESGAFIQSGRIVAGSYDYHLQQGNKSGENTNNWYLTSNENGSDDNTYRPERGSYASNLAAAGTMFDMRLSDRQGKNRFTDPVTGEVHETSLWGYISGGHSESEMSDGQSDNTGNRVVFRLGGDVISGQFTGTDSWHVGVMAGYGKQDNKTHNAQSGYTSRGNVWGHSAGVYGTWYQNADSRDGLYVDTWAHYSWFTNAVKGDELNYENYNSKGFSLSAETGYNLKAGEYKTAEGKTNRINVRPQAQLRWSGIKADEHTEDNGTVVQSVGGDNLQSRLGVRVSVSGDSLQSDNGVRQFEPFIEVNWINNSKEYGVRMNGENADIQGSRNLGEVKVGAEGQITENLSIWGNVAHQKGSNSYQDTQGMLGIQYRF